MLGYCLVICRSRMFPSHINGWSVDTPPLSMKTMTPTPVTHSLVIVFYSLVVADKYSRVDDDSRTGNQAGPLMKPIAQEQQRLSSFFKWSPMLAVYS